MKNFGLECSRNERQHKYTFANFHRQRDKLQCEQFASAVSNARHLNLLLFLCLVLRGKVTFEDIESARKAVEQYNGMDMGMGTELEMASV